MVRACWLRYVLGERYVVGLIERLHSSPRLRQLCGLGHSVPSEATFSRFFSMLTGYVTDVEQMIVGLVAKLREHLPNLGRVVGVDSTDIESWGNPGKKVDKDANWGARTVKGKRRYPSRNGNSDENGEDKKEMFYGYKLHAFNDLLYGVPLVQILRPASENDNPHMETLIEKAEKMYGDQWNPEKMAPEYMVADKGYDGQPNHRLLYERGIKPIIHIVSPTAKDKLYDGIYGESGSPTCDGEKEMEFIYTDPETGEHVYRCSPEGCKLKQRMTGAIRYCDTQEHREHPLNNLRVVGVVARASREWKVISYMRPVIERFFGSAKTSQLLDRSLYLRMDKVELHAALSTVTYLATMLTRVENGDTEKMRHMRIRGIW